MKRCGAAAEPEKKKREPEPLEPGKVETEETEGATE